MNLLFLITIIFALSINNGLTSFNEENKSFNKRSASQENLDDRLNRDSKRIRRTATSDLTNVFISSHTIDFKEWEEILKQPQSLQVTKSFLKNAEHALIEEQLNNEMQATKSLQRYGCLPSSSCLRMITSNKYSKDFREKLITTCFSIFNENYDDVSYKNSIAYQFNNDNQFWQMFIEDLWKEEEVLSYFKFIKNSYYRQVLLLKGFLTFASNQELTKAQMLASKIFETIINEEDPLESYIDLFSIVTATQPMSINFRNKAWEVLNGRISIIPEIPNCFISTMYQVLTHSNYKQDLPQEQVDDFLNKLMKQLLFNALH